MLTNVDKSGIDTRGLRKVELARSSTDFMHESLPLTYFKHYIECVVGCLYGSTQRWFEVTVVCSAMANECNFFAVAIADTARHERRISISCDASIWLVRILWFSIFCDYPILP